MNADGSFNLDEFPTEGLDSIEIWTLLYLLESEIGRFSDLLGRARTVPLRSYPQGRLSGVRPRPPRSVENLALVKRGRYPWLNSASRPDPMGKRSGFEIAKRDQSHAGLLSPADSANEPALESMFNIY